MGYRSIIATKRSTQALRESPGTAPNVERSCIARCGIRKMSFPRKGTLEPPPGSMMKLRFARAQAAVLNISCSTCKTFDGAALQRNFVRQQNRNNPDQL